MNNKRYKTFFIVIKVYRNKGSRGFDKNITPFLNFVLRKFCIFRNYRQRLQNRQKIYRGNLKVNFVIHLASLLLSRMFILRSGMLFKSKRDKEQIEFVLYPPLPN